VWHSGSWNRLGVREPVEIVSDDRSSPRNGLGLSERPVSIKDLWR
jgi:hypothetical protein